MIDLLLRVLSGHPLLAFLAMVLAALWLLTLIRALTHPHLDPVTRFMWVFVIVTLSVLGAALYTLLVPSRTGASDRFFERLADGHRRSASDPVEGIDRSFTL